ncbi:protein fecR [Alcanivorax xiamenensis]|uniref:Protein fecR n=1 Tax=Alcanivorax xiamenensis TaxID=1177156 RepID=A0ABQ6YB36_9GAMM|nr:FecR domain-containing protein [Alcanivorax xiamenensis]KAF0807153.1 protein fecR [Alcanivorax xiamenensis]
MPTFHHQDPDRDREPSSVPDSLLLQQATDWMLALEAAPDDRRLRREVSRWVARNREHKAAWDRVSRAWQLMGTMPVDRASWPDASEPKQTGWRRPPVRWLVGTALAACLMIAVLPGLGLRWPLWVDHVSAVAQSHILTLPDGTRVQLGADSALNEHFDGRERRVELMRGQAFFDIAPDASRPFIVTVRGMEIRDIGTAFDVLAGERQAVVTVQEGEVVISSRAVERHVLPGEQLVLNPDGGEARLHHLPIDRVAGWREGRLFVQDRSVADLLDTLRRYYKGYILIADDDLGARRVTGSYDLTDVDAALAALVRPHDGRVIHVTPFLRVVLGPSS